MNNSFSKRATAAALITISSIAHVSFAEDNEPFSYISVAVDTVRSTHALPYRLSVPAGFDLYGPHHYQAVFNEHPFNVSMVAMVKGSTAIVLHAEMVADSSGFLDYSYLEPANLSGIAFFKKEQCAEISATEVATAPDLNYMKEQGFDFAPATYLVQYFKNSEDGNSEIVLTYGQKLDSCTESLVTEAFKQSVASDVKALLLLSRDP